MDRIYNFASGPAAMPEEVLSEIRDELYNYNGCGMSVLEMNYTGSAFGDIIDEAESSFRQLMAIPEDYCVLFVPGGGWMQFGMVPINLMNTYHQCDFITTGVWCEYAMEEAKKYGTVREVASSKDTSFNYIPQTKPSDFSQESDYVFLCTNNTSYGTRIAPNRIPDTNGIPIVADMTSGILSEPYCIEDFGLIFAVTQKNMGASGLSIVVAKKSLIHPTAKHIPKIMSYDAYYKSNSTFSTPPTFSVYIVNKMLRWTLKQGGVQSMSERNHYKANLLYDYIDNSQLFYNHVRKDYRSIMNVTFTTGSDESDQAFTVYANAHGFANLKGFRTVGGIRAGI